MKSKPLQRLIILGSAIILTPVCPAASMFTGIHVFGDSLSDTGNLSLATGGTNPGADYSDGKFSNGRIWVEHLATDYLGLAAPIPDSLPGGTNHAWAGALSSGGATFPPGALEQINGFIGGGGTFSSTDLVTLWAGANDFLGGGTDPFDPVNNLVASIQALAAAGVVTILVPNMPDLSDTPQISSQNIQAVSDGAQALSAGFNALLAGQLADQRDLLGINLISLDVFSLGKEIIADPAAFGLVNTSDAALLTGNILNANDYIYWDNIHPTEAMHAIIAERGARALGVPEPSAAMFLAIGVFGIVLRRRRGR